MSGGETISDFLWTIEPRNPINLERTDEVPRPGLAELFLICARFDVWGSQVSALRQFLSPDETERSRRFRREKDARRYEIGRGLLRQVLGKLHSKPPAELEFQYLTYGKPSLPGGLAFNLSHNADYLLLVVGSCEAVGADVEDLRADTNPGELAKQIFSSREKEVFFSLPEGKRRQAFFRAWTIKEAWLKATGKGFSLPPEEVEVEATSEKVEIAWANAVWGARQGYRVASLVIDAANPAAIAFPEPVTRIVAYSLVPRL